MIPLTPKPSLVTPVKLPTTVYLPNLEAGWLWPRRLNRHTDAIRQECLNWAASFRPFTPKAQRAFDKCNFSLLTGLMYPRLTREQLKCACDVMNLFFIFDEHSDKSSPEDVWKQVHILMDALLNPESHRPVGEWVGGEIARQFWIQATKISTKTFQTRFLTSWEDYLKGTAQQAEDRSRAHIRTIDSYLDVRRQTIGVMPSLVFFQIDMDLPSEVLAHPTIKELEILATDLTIIANDILSFNKEQASGDDEHNLITIAMNEFSTDLQSAVDWAGRIHADLVFEFNQVIMLVPRWGGAVDLDVQTYVDGIAQWVGANVQWSFESERYFGKHGLEVKKTRVLHLLPRVAQFPAVIGPVAIAQDISG